MSERGPHFATGRPTGNDARLSVSHSYQSHTSRLQAGDPDYVIQKRQERMFSLALHVIALLAFVLLSRWCKNVITEAVLAPLTGFGQAVELFAAILMTFMGVYAIMRLVQAAIRTVFRSDERIEWPRRDVDWGKQAVVLDRDGIAIANRLARRTYVWNSMAQMTEDEVFVVTRKEGTKIVIPKDAEDEDELRGHLMYGLSLSTPLNQHEPS